MRHGISCNCAPCRRSRRLRRWRENLVRNLRRRPPSWRVRRRNHRAMTNLDPSASARPKVAVGDPKAPKIRTLCSRHLRDLRHLRADGPPLTTTAARSFRARRRQRAGESDKSTADTSTARNSVISCESCDSCESGRTRWRKFARFARFADLPTKTAGRRFAGFATPVPEGERWRFARIAGFASIDDEKRLTAGRH